MRRKSKKASGKAEVKKRGVMPSEGKEAGPSEGKKAKPPEWIGEKTEKRFQLKVDFRRDVIGRVWLRLDYYDRRLMKLDDDRQKTFLDSYMQSSRQLNQSLFVIVVVMIIAYIAYAVRMLGMGETAAAWIILLYLLFYIARHHRNENEKLIEFLLDSEITPEYARKK